MKRYKYPRTYHLPSSEKAMNDDKILQSLEPFTGELMVVTEKYDGENTTIYSDGYVHARSMDHNKHPGRTYVSKVASQLKSELPEGWRVCGENLQARHTIPYEDLPDWFLAYSIWNENNECLPWVDFCIWCTLLGIQHVRTIKEFFTFDENEIAKLVEEIRNPGIEGFVIRNRKGFHYDNFSENVCKFVYKHFVIPEELWMYKPVVLNGRKKDEFHVGDQNSEFVKDPVLDEYNDV